MPRISFGGKSKVLAKRMTAVLLVFFISIMYIPSVYAAELPPQAAEAPAQPVAPTDNTATVPTDSNTAPSAQDSTDAPPDTSQKGPFDKPDNPSEEKSQNDKVKNASLTSLNQNLSSVSNLPPTTIRQILPETDKTSGALIYDFPISIPPVRGQQVGTPVYGKNI